MNPKHVPLLNHILGISIASAQVASNAAVDKVASGTSDELGKLIANFLAQIPLWIAAIVVAIFSYAIAIIVRKSIESKLAQNGIAEEHREIQIVASRSSFFIVLVIGATISLSIVGIDLAPIVAAGAFGLGFALQDIIMNMISGMFILASRHFTIGDIIKMDGVSGKIEEIQTRATIIKGFDGTRIVVPNAQLFKNVVVSKTSNPYRKITFIMGVDYSADLKQAMELTLAVVKSIPLILKKPKPKVIFYEWGDYSINFRINVWINSRGGKLIQVKNAVIMALSEAYNDSGINIPYPIQTIQLDKAEEEEFSKEKIDQKIADIKAGLRAQSLSQPKRVPALPAAETSGPAPVGPVLATAIETTVNSPGQSWLQKTLDTQVNSTAQPLAAPSIPTPTPAPLPENQTPIVNQTAPATPPPAPQAVPTPEQIPQVQQQSAPIENVSPMIMPTPPTTTEQG